MKVSEFHHIRTLPLHTLIERHFQKDKNEVMMLKKENVEYLMRVVIGRTFSPAGA